MSVIVCLTLVVRLAQRHRNITVVGDSDQSVYRFRGADIRNIIQFEDAFPDTTVVLLEQNYRSTQTILDAANAVIVNNVGRKDKDLWTDSGEGARIVRYYATDEGDESTWVASTVRQLSSERGAAWTTRTATARAAMIRLRTGKFRGTGSVPTGNSLRTAPRSTMLAASASLRRG